jgi:hypothetical protein
MTLLPCFLPYYESYEACAPSSAVENLEGRLRLRWICPETGKRRTLALGVDDSTTGRAFASTIKDRIENDAKHGYYDSTLLKYRPQTIGKNASEITTVELESQKSGSRSSER